MRDRLVVNILVAVSLTLFSTLIYRSRVQIIITWLFRRQAGGRVVFFGNYPQPSLPKTKPPESVLREMFLDERYDNSCGNITFSNTIMRASHRTFHNKTILVVGDSRMNQFFRYMKLRTVTASREAWNRLFFGADRSDFFHDAVRNNIWHFVFSSMPDEETRCIIHDWTVLRTEPADYLVYETGAWTVFKQGPAGADEFRNNLTQIARSLAENKQTTKNTIPIWLPTVPFHSNIRKFRQFWVTHYYNNTDSLVESASQTVADVATAYNITVWTSAYRIAKENPRLYRDQMHPGVNILRIFSCQLLMAVSTEIPCEVPANCSIENDL